MDNSVECLIVGPYPEVQAPLNEAAARLGLTLAYHRTDGGDRLSILLTPAIDLVVCPLDDVRSGVSRIQQLLHESGLHPPIIAMAKQLDIHAVEHGLRAGALATIGLNNVRLLDAVAPQILNCIVERQQRQYFESRYREAEQQCRAHLDAASECLMLLDTHRVHYLNPPCRQLLGLGDDQPMETLQPANLFSGEDWDGIVQTIQRVLRGETVTHAIQVSVASRHSGDLAVAAEFSLASHDGRPCVRLALDAGTAQENTDQPATTIDPVSGLYTRAYLFRRIELALNRELDHGRGHLLYVLIDNYRNLVESCGLHEMDQAVRQIAHLLTEAAGREFLAARTGDSTFALLSTHSNSAEALAAAERIRDALAGYVIETAHGALLATASIGIAGLPGQTSIQALIQRADNACERARQQGGNRIEVYSGFDADNEQRQLQQEIREALEHPERLQLLFQPVVSLSGDAPPRYDVALRLRDSSGEIILPSEFLPLARRLELDGAIDRKVIEHAMHSIGEQLRQGIELELLVKVESSSLSDPDLPLWLHRQLAAAQLPPQHLGFQISADQALTHLRDATSFASAMHTLGCHIALMHLHAGAGNEQLLGRLKPEYVKLHPDLIHNLSQDRRRQAQVQQLIHDIQQAGALPIVPMVENATTLPEIWRMGATLVQGYFLQRPSAAMNYDFSSL